MAPPPKPNSTPSDWLKRFSLCVLRVSLRLCALAVACETLVLALLSDEWTVPVSSV